MDCCPLLAPAFTRLEPNIQIATRLAKTPLSQRQISSCERTRRSKRQKETFEQITMGHIRSHGCATFSFTASQDAAITARRSTVIVCQTKRPCARCLTDGLHTIRNDRC